jgi:hypothetical protein
MPLNLTDQFFADLAAMGERLDTDPAIWLAVWTIESGLDPQAFNHAPPTAQGLNQFIPGTLKGIGAPANFVELSGEEQLPWIEKFMALGIIQNGGPYRTPGRYYWSNFYGDTMKRGNSPDAVVVSSTAESSDEQRAYNANKVLDFDGNGVITQGDLDTLIEKRAIPSPKYQEALARLRAAQLDAANSAGMLMDLGPAIVGLIFAAGGAWMANRFGWRF